MNLREFQTNALKTESIPEVVKVNKLLLLNILDAYIGCGNIIEQIKHNTLYDIPYNIEKYRHDYTTVFTKLNELSSVAINDATELKINIRIFHAIIGIATEAVELVEPLISNINNTPYDTVNISEEFADAGWYMAIAYDEMGLDIGDTLHIHPLLGTDWKPEEIRCNKLLLINTLKTFVCLGNILDQIKKNAMYGKPYNIENFRTDFTNSFSYMNELSSVALNDTEVLDINIRLYHSIIGISCQSVELAKALVDNILYVEYDYDKICDNLRNIRWYLSFGYDEMGIQWDASFGAVIEKLRIRYPDKFSSQHAITRDLDAERVALEVVK
jgi:hypothetical protein